MNEQHYEYRTGDTKPRKNSYGLIALLLICVIFLTGVVSVLSLLNIHLFRKLQQDIPKPPLSFADGDRSAVSLEGDSLTIGGLTFQELPGVYQQFYGLPQGLCVVVAPEEGQIIPGDVLVSFGSTQVATLAELNALFAACAPGDAVELQLYRQNQQNYTHTIIIE